MSHLEECMDSLVYLKQNSPTTEADAFSTVSLLESGLNCIQQGRSTEGTAFLALARERLLPDQVQLFAVIESLNRATATHMHAQQALHEASKRFVESSSEQQAQMAALQKMLPALAEQVESVSFAKARSKKNTRGNQSLRLLQSPQVPAEDAEESRSWSPVKDGNTLPALYITCFGQFEVRRFSPSDQPIDLCQNLKGQAIMRFLIAQPKHRATADILMATFWPEDAPEVACHKLRIAISALRCSLNRDVVSGSGGGYILCKNQFYEVNQSVVLKSDVDEFLALYQAGQQANDGEAATHYERACRLYMSPFLPEDLYADWSTIQREELSKTYVVMCGKLAEYNLANGCYENAVNWASAILKVDRCDEEAHRQLMQSYAAQGRRSEALRQYRQCQRVLGEELGVQPMAETQKLIQMLMNGEDFSTIERK
jgi:DNA-binding SARP family transcriptional activator